LVPRCPGTRLSRETRCKTRFFDCVGEGESNGDGDLVGNHGEGNSNGDLIRDR
jgi:hypothetical protein